MRLPSVLALLALLALLLPAQAEAQSTEGWGIGAVLGEPTGLTLSFDGAYQVHAAWSFSGDAAVQVNADYLFFRGSLAEELGTYIGIGARVKFADDAQVGIRLPLGIRHVLEGAPVEFFGEIVPILDLAPDTDFDLNAALGVRFYPGG